MRSLLGFSFLLIGCSIFAQTEDTGTINRWGYEKLNIPRQTAIPKKTVTVAVIDDAFRLSHNALKEFIYTNNREIPDNFRDDDNNGFIDDIHGWDISDGDNDVSVPEGREDFFYHGTHISGIIAAVFKDFYGESASDYLKIIPVKVLLDNAGITFLQDGYKGIEYACSLNPDIICCAWSGGTMSNDVKNLLAGAIEKGTLVIGAAGNLSSEKEELPASFRGVISVAAIDSSLQKTKESNYGMRIDFAAPGEHIYGPSPVADNAYFHSNGTSPAAALVAGCFAALKALFPDVQSQELIEAVTNTSIPVDKYNIRYAGKLGSGIPDMTNAVEFLTNKDFKYLSFNNTRPKGNLFYDRKETPNVFEVKPEGAFKGIHFFASSPKYNGNIRLSNSDSVFYSGSIKKLHEGIFVPGSAVKVELQSNPKPTKEMKFSYYVETIDSTILYCKDTKIMRETSGIVTDGSGGEDYANFSVCKWQLKVPEGNKIRIEFLEMDTQTNVDFVWIFDGRGTLPENLLAKFSGQKLPPVITTLTNEALVWFVTDGAITGKGWKMKYEPTTESIIF